MDKKKKTGKRRKAGYMHSLSSTMFSEIFVLEVLTTQDHYGKKDNPFPNYKFGKGRNCSLRAISLFPAVFSKVSQCRHVKTRACLGKD